MSDKEYSTDEYTKKRRASRETEEQFNRSKKTHRTPPKYNKDDDKLDLLLNMMKEIKNEQAEMRKEMQQNGEEQKIFNAELLRLKQENDTLKKENAEIKKK